MLKAMWNDIPTWYKIASVLTLIVGISAFAYSASKCGIGKTFLLGNGALYAAVTGMCDENN
jgi:hypothetical protein